MLNQKFGRLLVIAEDTPAIKPSGGKERRYRCLCDCGNYKTIRYCNLKSGTTISCGCYRKETNKTHHKSRTPEYTVWIEIKRRCYNPNSKSYPDYGGRGIIVCDQWKNDFQAFFDYVGYKPSPNHSIDRIDVNGNYEPGNVRWADANTQAANQRLRSNNTSGVKGVYFHKRAGKWVAVISRNKKRKQLGSFDTFEEAVAARLKAEQN